MRCARLDRGYEAITMMHIHAELVVAAKIHQELRDKLKPTVVERNRKMFVTLSLQSPLDDCTTSLVKDDTSSTASPFAFDSYKQSHK